MKPSHFVQRILLGIISAVGAATFVFFFALTFHTPEWVEDFAADFVEKEVSERVDTFEQNWLLTIIYNDYLGFTYLVYLAVVFGFLCDIILNRARVTTRIVNAVLDAVGSAASAVPC